MITVSIVDASGNSIVGASGNSLALTATPPANTDKLVCGYSHM